MIKVLRLGHRVGRDDRISTHVALAARQWGASEIVFSGDEDSSMMNSIRDMVERWGGEFEVSFTENWRSEIKDFEGLKVHLTMYGERINDKQDLLRRELEENDLLLIVGAEKVPRWVYRNCDYNISVGNQPHSEVAALGVFMDRFFDLKEDFEGGDIEVLPSEDEKLTKKR